MNDGFFWILIDIRNTHSAFNGIVQKIPYD